MSIIAHLFFSWVILQKKSCICYTSYSESYKDGGEISLRKGVVPMHYLKFILIERRFHPPMVLMVSFLSGIGVILVLLTWVIKALNSFLASITHTLLELVKVHQALKRLEIERNKHKNLKKKNRR